MRLSIAFLAMMIAGLCGCRRANSILPEEKFVSVYADMLVAAVDAAGAPIDSAARADSARQVLLRDTVSRETFDATVQWYNGDVQRWNGFYEKVARELERRRAAGQKS